MKEKVVSEEATIKSMKEITMALIGIAVCCRGVFNADGFSLVFYWVIYRQFSITMSSPMTCLSLSH